MKSVSTSECSAANRKNRSLRALAKLLGIQATYRDGLGVLRRASDNTLMLGVRALGADIADIGSASQCLQELHRRNAERLLSAVQVLRPRRNEQVTLQLRANECHGKAICHVLLEDGRSLGFSQVLTASHAREVGTFGSQRYVRTFLKMPEAFPVGYHRLVVQLGQRRDTCHVLVAPSRVFHDPVATPQLGLFAPLYAARDKNDWGLGNYSSLAGLARIAKEWGASVVGTLPLLPVYLCEPFEPSPYSPVSRRLWNEFMVDPHAAANDLAVDCPPLSTLHESLNDARAGRLVDYAQVGAHLRAALGHLAKSFFASHANDSEHRRRYEQFINTQPFVRDYAAFRAATERHGVWHRWPEKLCQGQLAPGDFDDSVRDVYLFAQWQAHEQLSQAGQGGAGLYVDLPLGVHPDGYDAWRERQVFVHGMSVGAPPDDFFTQGQNWGFAPLHPWLQRQRGYRYLRSCLQHHFSVAKMLRIDHVMGLFRLFWIPQGASAKDGFYVHNQAKEQLAVLAIESSRAQVEVVGEDLGTVPKQVRRTMDRMGICRMFVGQFEVGENPKAAMNKPAKHSVASLNTHDMASFAGFWQAKDIDLRVTLGLLGNEEAALQRLGRKRVINALMKYFEVTENDGEPVLATLHRALADMMHSEARLVLVNLEDLWLEPEPQNVPGTWREVPNWQRKMALSLQQVAQTHALRDSMHSLVKTARGQW